ncbi:hypothetical protein PG984_005365 [Apiospora sp. TS-2023a]
MGNVAGALASYLGGAIAVASTGVAIGWAGSLNSNPANTDDDDSTDNGSTIRITNAEPRPADLGKDKALGTSALSPPSAPLPLVSPAQSQSTLKDQSRNQVSYLSTDSPLETRISSLPSIQGSGIRHDITSSTNLQISVGRYQAAALDLSQPFDTLFGMRETLTQLEAEKIQLETSLTRALSDAGHRALRGEINSVNSRIRDLRP